MRLAAGANIRLCKVRGCLVLVQGRNARNLHLNKTPTYKNALPTTINPKQLIPTRINFHTLSYVSYPNCKIVESIYAKRDRAGTPKVYRLPVSRCCSRISSSSKSTTPCFGVWTHITRSELTRWIDLKVKRGQEHQKFED